VWEVILKELQSRNNPITEKQIKCLYELFKHNFSNGKRTARLPYVFNAIGYLTHKIDFSIPIRNDMKIFIQVQLNINKLFFDKKINEINEEGIIEKVQKKSKKEPLDKEISNDKINLFNNIDSIFMKNES
jgi:hypothetical protein